MRAITPGSLLPLALVALLLPAPTAGAQAASPRADGGIELAYGDDGCDGSFSPIEGARALRQTFRVADFGLEGPHRILAVAVYLGPQDDLFTAGIGIGDGSGPAEQVAVERPPGARGDGRTPVGWRTYDVAFAGVASDVLTVDVWAVDGVGSVCLDRGSRLGARLTGSSGAPPEETALGAGLLVKATVEGVVPPTIADIRASVERLDPGAFAEPAEQRRATLLRKLDAAERQIESADPRGAAERLSNDVLRRVDGHGKDDLVTDRSSGKSLSLKVLFLISQLAKECFGAVAAGAYTAMPLNVILGTPGDDSISGTEGDDLIFGRQGEDVIHGNGGEDVICAGPGDGPGTWNLVSGGADEDALFGAGGDDSINGGPGDDIVVGGDGDDSISGGDQNDYLLGEDGEDSVHGGEGDDSAHGDGDDDQIFGGNGDDTISGEGYFPPNPGNDTLFGGPGHNGISGGSGDDTLFGGQDGNGFGGDKGSDTIFGGAGVDLGGGDSGDDTFFGGGGADVFDGGYGDDHLSGGPGNDSLTGLEHDDLLLGGDGDDLLVGEFGDDVLYGGAGSDFLGDPGDEWGNDTLDGGTGVDGFYAGTYQRPDLPASGDFDHCYMDAGESQFGCEVIS